MKFSLVAIFISGLVFGLSLLGSSRLELLRVLGLECNESGPELFFADLAIAVRVDSNAQVLLSISNKMLSSITSERELLEVDVHVTSVGGELSVGDSDLGGSLLLSLLGSSRGSEFLWVLGLECNETSSKLLLANLAIAVSVDRDAKMFLSICDKRCSKSSGDRKLSDINMHLSAG
jgi:hypothetical protein